MPLLMAAHALAAFALALLAPAFLIAVAPLVLGVPHLASDVRHLLLRRASPRWWLAASASFAALLIAIRALAEASPALAPSLAAEQGVAAGWVLLGAIGGAVAGASGGRGRARAWSPWRPSPGCVRGRRAARVSDGVAARSQPDRRRHLAGCSSVRAGGWSGFRWRSCSAARGCWPAARCWRSPSATARCRSAVSTCSPRPTGWRPVCRTARRSRSR